MFSTLMALDRATSEKMFRLGESVPRPLWQLLELSGDGIVWLAIAISALLIPGTSIERKTYIANFLLGLLVDLAETGLLKGFVRRERPVYNANAKDMRVVVNVDNYSFPSGHSSRISFIFLFATMSGYFSGTMSSMLLAIWAFTVAVSRCIMGRHYFSDVLGGLFLGFVTIFLISKGSYHPEGFIVRERHTNALLGLMEEALHWKFKP